MGNPDKTDDAFMRAIHFPEEDRHRFTRRPYTEGYRWFRSENVEPIEKWRKRKRKSTTTSKPDEAA
jgi:hypothetical protein